MRRKLRILAAVLGMLVLVGSTARAALVTYSVQLNPGNTFDVYASVSQGDNAGLAAFGVPLGGGITSIDNKAPYGQFGSGTAGSGAIGFTEVRSLDGDTLLSGSQLTVPTPTPLLVYGLGQTAGSLSSVANFGIFGNQEQLTYGAPLLLASGTYSGVAPFIIANGNLGANVFLNNLGAAVVAANVVVPEPSSIVLAGLGAVALLVARRRAIKRA
jgi:hypothetical protein